MTHNEIEFIIVNNIGSYNILGDPIIKICLYNKQVEEIIVVLKEEDIPLGLIGDIMEDLDRYTQNEEYGDITSLTFKLDRLHELPSGDITTALHFNINIDS